jgi:hypothetical protein
LREIPIKGGIDKMVDTLRYVEHVYYKPGTTEHTNYCASLKGSNCAYWPHFSFRPSVIRVSVLQDVGKFYNTSHFEMAYAHDYINKGYKSVYFKDFCCIHNGKKTWEYNTNSLQNAYALNGMDQFVARKNLPDVNVLSRVGTDEWTKFKEFTVDRYRYHRNMINYRDYIHFDAKEKLIGNTYDYRRDILANTMGYVNILTNFSKNDTGYVVIVDELSRIDPTLLDHCINNKISTVFMANGIMCGIVLFRDDCSKLMEQVSLKQSTDELFRGLAEKGIVAPMNCQMVGPNKIDIKQYPGFKFYCLMDSFGGDLVYVGGKMIDELIEAARKDPACVSFNTLGYLKKTMTDEKDWIILPQSDKLEQGLYVKIM